MKKPILTAFLLLLLDFQVVFNQEVTNVNFQQEADNLIITYDLIADKPTDIRVYATSNSKGDFGFSLRNVRGDVGNRILPGKNKEVIINDLSRIEDYDSGQVIIKVEPVVIKRKHAIALSPKLPATPIGFRYAYLGRFGGYVSFASDLDLLDWVDYLTIGPAIRLTYQLHAYVGGGMELTYRHKIMEAGIMLRHENYVIDVGVGYDFDGIKYSFGNIGFGITF